MGRVTLGWTPWCRGAEEVSRSLEDGVRWRRQDLDTFRTNPILVSLFSSNFYLLLRMYFSAIANALIAESKSVVALRENFLSFKKWIPQNSGASPSIVSIGTYLGAWHPGR